MGDTAEKIIVVTNEVATVLYQLYEKSEYVPLSPISIPAGEVLAFTNNMRIAVLKNCIIKIMIVLK